MQSRLANAIPPDLQQLISPQQVWEHLSPAQRQAVRETLIHIVEISLQLTTTQGTKEEKPYEEQLNHE